MRIENLDGGALGGTTSVGLYSLEGLMKEEVLTGEWNIVEQKDLHWDGNGHLLITYDGRWGNIPTCYRARSIEVNCIPAPTGIGVGSK